jgi:hypothetical protein
VREIILLLSPISECTRMCDCGTTHRCSDKRRDIAILFSAKSEELHQRRGQWVAGQEPG